MKYNEKPLLNLCYFKSIEMPVLDSLKCHSELKISGKGRTIRKALCPPSWYKPHQKITLLLLQSQPRNPEIELAEFIIQADVKYGAFGGGSFGLMLAQAMLYLPTDRSILSPKKLNDNSIANPRLVCRQINDQILWELELNNDVAVFDVYDYYIFFTLNSANCAVLLSFTFYEISKRIVASSNCK